MFRIRYLISIVPFLIIGHGYQLKQVVILSRHNIRTPFYHGSDLEIMTPKQWPSWSEEPGTLTPKGRKLERSMGKYFSDWMIREALFNDTCPRNDAFVYANSIQRTKETAKSFVEGAFGSCVSVFAKNMDMDPVFNIIVRNGTTEFKDIVEDEMNKTLNSVNLKSVYLELDQLLDIGNSTYCKAESICELNKIRNKVAVESQKPPSVSGALELSWMIVDSFLMAYYDGKENKDVAWGQIQTTKQWNTLITILNTYHQLCYETNILDKDVSSTLLSYLKDIFQKGKKKFYLLVGHDANIISLMSTLKFKSYALHEQFEKAPIGGKLVFQKWYDAKNDQDLLRVNYVYQSMKQIRDGAVVSLQNPPYWETVEMKNCVTVNGFCRWKDFMNVLNKV